MKLYKNMLNIVVIVIETLLPYEYEFSCFSCGYNVIRRKHELTKL